MEENELQQNVTTDKLVSDIHNIIEQGRQQAYAVANQVAVLTYWHIGRRIVEEEQHGKARAQYGTRLIKTLAEQLMPKYGSTFSKRNLGDCEHACSQSDLVALPLDYTDCRP